MDDRVELTKKKLMIVSGVYIVQKTMVVGNRNGNGNQLGLIACMYVGENIGKKWIKGKEKGRKLKKKEKGLKNKSPRPTQLYTPALFLLLGPGH